MLDEVMQGEVAYRQLVLRNNGEELRLPLTAPINDLLGQLRPSQDGYLSYLVERYSSFSHDFYGLGADRTAFLEAAKSSAKGKLSAAVAPHLERVRFTPDGRVDVPDFSALAAWSLLESVRRQSLKLIRCPNCKGQWLGAPEGSRYCQRVAPGQGSKDCRTLAYEKRVAGDKEYGRYRREYKRLTELQRRGTGTLDVVELMNWRHENSPANWLPLDEWRAKRVGKED
jgi:Zn-finger nucleic acid-binding protein